MMADTNKAFNTKSELFTEYSEKNRYLLDLIKKERRKIIDERNLKKNSKAIKNNYPEKDKRRSCQNNTLNSFNKTLKSSSKFKGDLKDKNNNFSSKNKFMIKTGVY